MRNVADNSITYLIKARNENMKYSVTIRFAVVILAAVTCWMTGWSAELNGGDKPKYVFLFIGDGMSTPQHRQTSGTFYRFS